MTAHVCEQAKLYGATPERDEFDPRETWERETAIGAVTEAFSVLADGIGMTGFQLADEASSLLWGFVNTLDAQIRRLERSIDRISPELRDLQKEQDGDPDAVFRKLDGARKKYPDMVLVHGGGPGVEKFAARWAEARGVHQVVCRPDWNTHGKAAPFRRNDDLLNLLPKGLILFPGSGITANLGDKAESVGIPVLRCQ